MSIDIKSHWATLVNDGASLAVSLEYIDPETAKEYLKANKRNRNISESQIKKICEAARGDWVLNGATIVFDSNGDLSDGQHRLIAISRTGETLPTLVVRGVEPLAAQDTTDNTRRRTLGTQLQMRGEANYKTLAGALNIYWKFGTTESLAGNQSSMPSVVQGLRLLEENPNIRESVKIANRLKDAPVRYPSGLAAALHYTFASIDAEDADYFWAKLHTGSELRDGSPIALLRERMIVDASRSAGKQAMTVKYRAALTIKAWNAFREGRDVGILKWSPGGRNPEAFPSIYGQDEEVPA